MTKPVAYIENDDRLVMDLFLRAGFALTSTLNNADLLCLSGGCDIDASLYGHPNHHTTFSRPSRDEYCKVLYHEALASGKPIVGICRGMQFINIMDGGKLYQDVDHHYGEHIMVGTKEDIELRTSSVHHQMIKPSKNSIVLMSSKNGGERIIYNMKKKDFEDKGNEDFEDVEAIYIPPLKAFGVQGHPEYFKFIDSPYPKWFFAKIEEYFGLKGKPV